MLAEVVSKLYYKVNYKLPKGGLKEELELREVGKSRGKPVYYRSGMPQGLSISPILSILSMELWNTPKGTTMYSDDGIFCGQTMKVFND